MTGSDTLFTQGVLSRLDAAAAKVGVAADQLWGLWLATWWRPLISTVLSGVVFVVCLIVFRRLWKWAASANNDIDEITPLIFIAGTIGVISLIAFGFSVSDSIAYSIDHRLYALDQLRQLIHK